MTPRRRLALGAAVLAAGSFAGGAYAATHQTSPRQAFLDDVAHRLHVSPRQLSSALEGALFDQLQAAVRAGRLTQAQANAIERAVRQRGAVPFGLLFGPRRFGLRGLGAGRPPFAAGGLIRAAAGYIGVSQAQLLDQLAAGKSLAQIASAHGRTPAGLERALLARARARLERMRARGSITSAQEQRALRRLRARINALVSGTGLLPPLLFAPPRDLGPALPSPPLAAPAT